MPWNKYDYHILFDNFFHSTFLVEFSSVDAWWSVILAILACVIFKPYKVNNAKSVEGAWGYLVILYGSVWVILCMYTMDVYI